MSLSDSISGLPNPFRASIVTDPWGPAAPDVSRIHEGVYSECLRAVDYVRHEHRSTSVLIHGAAGSGKTHLLGRLKRKLHLEDAPWRGSHSDTAFSWVRLNAPAGMLWRHVRRCLVRDLIRPDASRSPLFRILVHRLAGLREITGNLECWWEYLLSDAPDELPELIEQLVDSARLERAFAIVLSEWLAGRNPRDTSAWLWGDSLPDESLRRLGLPAEADDIHPEHAAREAVVGLCRLLSPEAVLVVSFDQVEALQSRADDLSGLFAFGQLMSVLHDETTNLLLLSCVQSSFAQQLRDKALGADYDRMREFGLRALSDLDASQASELVAARLEQVPGLADRRPAGASPLWPLSESDIRGSLVDGKSVTPRVLLAQCAERFDAIERGTDRPAEPPPSLDGLIERAWTAALHRANSESSVGSGERIVKGALRPLLSIVRPEWTCFEDHLLDDVDLVVSTADGRTAISLCLTESMTSLAARLKRLLQQLTETDANPAHSISQVVILRDTRTPLSRNAVKVREHLQTLEGRGAHHVQLTPEQIESLDAFNQLLADARAGDLAFGERTVSADEVETWVRDHLPRPLADFLQVACPQPVTATSDGLSV